MSGTSATLLGIIERTLKYQHQCVNVLYNSITALSVTTYSTSNIALLKTVKEVIKNFISLHRWTVRSTVSREAPGRPSPGSEDILEDPTPLALSVY